jgi:hypothetical protein
MVRDSKTEPLDLTSGHGEFFSHLFLPSLGKWKPEAEEAEDGPVVGKMVAFRRD